jgi:hypothetical protein
VNIPPPEDPVISSKSHPDEELWYSITEATFSWDIPYGVLGMRTGFTDDPMGSTTMLHEPPISEWTETNIQDGTWYFTAEYRNRGGWSTAPL